MKNYFQFACELEPIDRFPGCMSKDDLLENLLRQDTQAGFLLPEKRMETALRVMQLEQEAEQRTCEISGGLVSQTGAVLRRAAGGRKSLPALRVDAD